MYECKLPQYVKTRYLKIRVTTLMTTIIKERTIIVNSKISLTEIKTTSTILSGIKKKHTLLRCMASLIPKK